MIYRPAAGGDAPAIADLCCALGYPATATIIAQRVETIAASPVDVLLVAVAADGSPVGWIQAHYAYLIESGARVEILGLVVASTHRRCGIGRELLLRIESWASEKGAPAVVVRSHVDRQESHLFYPAVGYAVTKTQHVYRKRL
jgi:GNAT superfamily N-acetyltransferase